MAAGVTLRFVRRNGMQRFHVLWNGQIASNGDGTPPDSPSDPVDEDTPLTRQPVNIWPTGGAGHGFEPHGENVHGEPTNYGPGLGHGSEMHGVEVHGEYGDRVEWSTGERLPTLRDGAYKFAIRMEDEYGTIQTDALEVIDVNVAGTPRPPVNVRFVGWDAGDGEIDVAWGHSPDLI